MSDVDEQEPAQGLRAKSISLYMFSMFQYRSALI
jgi:hypothetical protein